ncbi:MAG TPA: fatty acyl-AMP ligase [Polyangiaceae bacterium]
MHSRPKHVAPTLVDAVRALADDRVRGFTFVRSDGTERLYSFHDMAVEAERRAGHLAARGLKKGDRLAMVLPEGDEFVLSFLGALFAGVVPVPIYPQLTFKNIEAYHDTVAHIARASGASMLLTSASTKQYVEPGVARVESRPGLVTVDELAGDVGKAGVTVSPEDLAFLQFTSGSTSRPKGVMVSQGNLAANAEAFMIHGLDRDPAVDKGVSWLPLFHDMGLIGFVVGPLFTSVPCVFLPTASFVRAPRAWLDKIHEHRGTITYAPNFAYALVAKRLKDKEVEGLDLSCLRIAGCGAEPIQARALRDFATRLAPAGFDPRSFLPSYGMAEATLAITFMPLREGLTTDRNHIGQELVDCGRVFPEHEIAIVDEEGRRLGERQIGQIVTRGPSVTKGYFNEPELTAETYKPIADEADGAPWLHTGDLGYMVGDRLFVCGRLKDIIIIRGRNYYPSDIEWAVSEIPGIRRGNVVAFGAPLEADGEEQLVICCEGTSGDASAIKDATIACVASQFGLTVQDVVVAPLASLPRTSSGKPQRRKTRQMYVEGTLPRVRHEPVSSGIESDSQGERNAIQCSPPR